jgi:hypothetical protein
MRTSDLNRYALSVGAAAALLAGCGGAQTSGAASQGVMPALHSAHSVSWWMKRDSSYAALLYVSNTALPGLPGNVYVFNYSSGTLVQTLTGFQSPQGMCVDNSGNIYITDANAADIVEYAHGGTSPIKTLSDSGEPTACSIDSRTGNLAVSNLKDFVSIYKHAKGTPTNYLAPYPVNFCAYHTHGNLFIAESGFPGILVAVLPSGGKSFENVNLDMHLGPGFPAGLQWYGYELVIAATGPENYPCCGRIYTLIIKGTSGRVAGSFHTRTTINDFLVYGPVVATTTGGKDVRFYDYPEGNGPVQTIVEPGYSSFGVTLSVAVSRSRRRK